MGKKKIITTIYKIINAGNPTDLKPYLSSVFWQFYWEHWDKYNQKPNKHIIKNLLIETLGGDYCG